MLRHSLKFPTRIAASFGGVALVASLFAGQVAAAAPTPGLLVHNYWGQPMTLDLGGTVYTVPADGQLVIPLAPGTYDLSANVNGADDSATTAEITVTPGEEVQMSTSAAGTFFQDMTPAVQPASQPAQPTVTTPAKPADRVAPAAAVVANTDPGKAVALDSTSHSIAPNQSLWYRFDLSGSDGSMAILSLPGAGGSALRFEVYSAGQATNWWSESPVGSGNLDDNNNLVWATNVDMNSSWLVRVINTGAQATNFQFAFTGPLMP